MYFNNCGIVIRPTVQFVLSYFVTDTSVTSKDYVEELTLYVTVPKPRGYKLSLYAGKEVGSSQMPADDPTFSSLSAGDHVLRFRLSAAGSNSSRTISWQLNHSGKFQALPVSRGEYDEDSAFAAPKELTSVSQAGDPKVRIRPFKPIAIDIYGRNTTIYLHDAD